ncbi:MAG TPA: class I SAM-dependent methyltransferase [Terriglobales bacterium]|nr:class I SAM-dependent methyltransferase [Terriglobales bacterium]
MQLGIEPDDAALRGAAVYSRPVLAIYDAFVLRFTNSFVWKCPSHYILDFYNQNVSDKHLDVGVGSGWFLDHCRFPPQQPQIALMDLNENSLRKTAKRLNRYRPTQYRRNVLQSINIDESDFGSIGLNYLLHCVPGNMGSKMAAFQNLKPLLREGGVIFGTTVLGVGVHRNWLGNHYMRIFNATGVFSNKEDRREELEYGLSSLFARCEITMRGCVAFFRAWK